MTNFFDNLYFPLACAYIRGVSLRTGQPELPASLLHTPLSALSEEAITQILCAGQQAQLKLYRFKPHDDLPRVRAVMGFLKAIYPNSLLDIGSGRGVFLNTFLSAFPYTSVTSLDILPHRVQALRDMAAGGVAFYDGVKETPAITEARNWIKAVVEDTDPVVLPEQAYVVSQILEAIYTSSKTGKPVYFE